MKVRELIDMLKECDPDAVVAMQDGSDVLPVDEFWTGVHDSDTGETGIEALTADMIDSGYTADDVVAGDLPAIVFFAESSDDDEDYNDDED